MIDPRIPLMGQQQQDTFSNLAQGIQMGQGLRQLISGRQLGKMQQLAPEDRQAFADKSMFSRELNAGIKANNAAQVAQAMALQKHNADVGKTQSEAFKNNTQGQGYGLDNSGKQLGAIQGAFQQASLTGDKAQVLLGMNALVRTGMMTPEDYQAQAAIVNAMTPAELKQYAGGINFANAKDPAALQYQSADNAATNQTTQRGQDITSQTAMRGQDIGAYTADKNREQQGQQFEQNYALAEQKARIEQNKGQIVNGADGKSYIYYPNLGKYEPMLDQTGQQVSKSSKSSTDIRKETERLGKMEAILKQAEDIIPKSTQSGFGGLVDSTASYFGKSTGGADSTAALKSLQGALVMMMPRMEGPQSDKDVQLYREMAGRLGDEIPTSQRMEAIKVIRDLNQKYAEIQGVQQQRQGVPYSSAGQQSTFNLFD